MWVPGSVIASCLVLLLRESPCSQNMGSARGWLPGVASWRVPVLAEHGFYERLVTGGRPLASPRTPRTAVLGEVLDS